MATIPSEKQTAKAFQNQLAKPDYKHHPDREILTMVGVQILMQVGETAVYQCIDKGLPKIKVGNGYRFVRKLVIQWLEDQSYLQPDPQPD